MQASRTEGGCQKLKRAKVGSVVQNLTISYFFRQFRVCVTVTTKKRNENDFFSQHDPERNVITVYTGSLTHLTVTFLPFALVLRKNKRSFRSLNENFRHKLE